MLGNVMRIPTVREMLVSYNTEDCEALELC